MVPVIISLMNSLPSSFQNRYRGEASARFGSVHDTSLVAEMVIRHLPLPVQKYLRYTGSVGKPRVFNFRGVDRGAMNRTLQSGWSDVSADQYNFFDDRARLFHIETTMFGIPIEGLHMHVGKNATMQSKAASIVQVVDATGEKMDQSRCPSVQRHVLFGAGYSH